MTPGTDHPRTLLSLHDVTLDAVLGGRNLGPINWCIRSGDWSILLGPPGAGKSAVLAAMAGLRAVSSGTLVSAVTERARGGSAPLHPMLGFVFEDGGRLLHRLTLADNVALPLRYHHNQAWEEAAPRVAALLELAGLSPQARATPSQLKPWQRQRGALARALALQPELLLLDNPTAGLPPQEVAWWQTTLTHLHRGTWSAVAHPMTLLLSCEDPRPWWDLGTQFTWLADGTCTHLGGREDAARHRDDIWHKLLSGS